MNPDLRKLADDYWEYTLESSPSNAHMLGDYRYMDRAEDVTRAAEDAEIATKRSFASRARAFDPEDLSPADKITRETLIFECESTADVTEMRGAEFSVDPIFGLQAVYQVALPQFSVETAEHADKMLDKLSAIAVQIDQATDRLREGVASGRVNADFAVTKTVEQLDALLGSPSSESPFLNAQMPDAYTDEDKAAWNERAASTLR